MDSDSTRHILQRRDPGGLKHSEIRCLAIQQLVRPKRLSVIRVNTKNDTADLFTKHLDGSRTRAFAKKLGLRFLDMAGGTNVGIADGGPNGETSTFSILHTDAHDRLDDISIHHKPHFPQIISVFKPSHIMVRSTEERFAVERMTNRGFGAKRIATTLGLPQSTTKRWLQRLRSNGDMASRSGAEAGLCVMSFCMFRLTSLGVSCVPLVCRSMAVMRSAFVPQRSSTPGFLLSHVAQSLVSANVCRRVASNATAAASSTCGRSTGQRSK